MHLWHEDVRSKRLREQQVWALLCSVLPLPSGEPQGDMFGEKDSSSGHRARGRGELRKLGLDRERLRSLADEAQETLEAGLRPLPDRIDIHVEAPRVRHQKVPDDRPGDNSPGIRIPLEAARTIQRA